MGVTKLDLVGRRCHLSFAYVQGSVIIISGCRCEKVYVVYRGWNLLSEKSGLHETSGAAIVTLS